jgi:hypothetical protein
MPQNACKVMHIGVGPTEELSLRVSVASLAKVVFTHPQAGHTVLALERKATLRQTGSRQAVTVKAQPFGGAVRLLNASALQELIGDFHFDNPRSRSEGDFRIQIRPSAWEKVKLFCLQHFRDEDETILEASPERELAEEFADSLRISLTSTQYRLQAMGSVIENKPADTTNIYAAGYPTVRIYNVFEVRVVDPHLAMAMLTNSESYSDQDLRDLVMQDARSGGKGRANAILAMPMHLVMRAYEAMSKEARNSPAVIEGHRLDGNVTAVLKEILAPKFQSL